MQLTDAVRSFDARLDPTSRAPLAVAFSGGGDSLALLVATLDWARGCGRKVVALHVDHGLQPQSGAFADFAEASAVKLGAGFRKFAWTGPKPTSGIPAAARDARLGLLAEGVRDLGGCVLLLGHTADDLAEGEWMRREGSTLGRLRAWSPSPVWPQGRDVFHFRPLLGCRRAELRADLTARGLPWLDDPANEDSRFARARARAALSASSKFSIELESPSPFDGGRVGMGVTLPRQDALSSARRAASPTSPSPGALSPPSPALPPSRGKGVDGVLCTPSYSQPYPVGGVLIPRAWLRAAADAEAHRSLSLAATCASGRQAPPRRERLERLLDRLRAAEPLIVTIGGARVVANEQEVLFGREVGRMGVASTEASVDRDLVWDGRFLISATKAGWRIAALGGHAARLPKAEREALKRVPPALRPALPVAIKDGETLTCPILAHGPVMAASLAGRRLLAAMGAVQTESQAMVPAHGEHAAGDLSLAQKYTKAET